ncbi:hypothetical protein [Phyllobacterium zundukense]|uniref:Uncharacterized protein n=1 Tax=Phyllobacterium zundukense TaxID=1867719 RepID=A0A2N9W4V0_9HYPH|nr:hypothetical protein [Phyllobacterium zundukense]ATU91766.1 hypothetical protein BLM14_09140 [Phyllobacterium zundukense]PIO46768.1 hypothetical protein B5P45_02935 [Phyllobacterium zundukense]
MPSISEKASTSPFTEAAALPSLIGFHGDRLAQVDIASGQDGLLQDAFAAEQSALEELLQYTPRDLAEVRTKTAYFLEHLDFLGCEDPRMVMFLRAMV